MAIATRGRTRNRPTTPLSAPAVKVRQQVWAAYWRGSQAGPGEALQGAAHADHCRLYWRSIVSRGLQRGATVRVLDLACGNAVLSRIVLDRVAEAAIDAVIVGIDYAVPALQHLRTSNGKAKNCPLAGDARALPFCDGRFDWVMSQFGLEYAGPNAFAEAARALAPGGQFHAIVHMKNGGVWRENSDNLNLLKAVRSSRLLQRFARLIESGAARESAFRTAAQSVVAELEGAPACAAKTHMQRMVPDLTDLASRRQNFDPAELTAWARNQQDALADYEFRMQSMLDAAMDDSTLRQALAPFAARQIDVAPFHTVDKQKPAAWTVAVTAAGG